MKKHFMLFIIWGALLGGLGSGVMLTRMVLGSNADGIGWVFTILTLLAAFALTYGVRIYKEGGEKK